MALTKIKQRFADEVLAGKSNKDAAIAAGYSAKTASAAGSRLVKEKEVAAYIAAHRKAKESKEDPPKVLPKFDLSQAMLCSDPRKFLLAAMNDLELDPRQRIDAAKALMPYEHPRKADSGKKEQKQQDAEKVASRFAPVAAPRLVVNSGKKV